jgi:hypothetical protein
MLRGLVNMKLEYLHAKYMWQVMKEFKRKPLNGPKPQAVAANKGTA